MHGTSIIYQALLQSIDSSRLLVTAVHDARRETTAARVD